MPSKIIFTWLLLEQNIQVYVLLMHWNVIYFYLEIIILLHEVKQCIPKPNEIVSVKDSALRSSNNKKYIYIIKTD